MKPFNDDTFLWGGKVNSTEPPSVTYSKEYLIDGLHSWSDKLNQLKQDIDCIYKALQAYIVEVEKKIND